MASPAWATKLQAESASSSPIRTATSPEPRVIWQAVYEDVQKSARVRAVLDFLAEILAPDGGLAT